MLTRQRKIEVLDSPENMYAKQECQAELCQVATNRIVDRVRVSSGSLAFVCEKLLDEFLVLFGGEPRSWTIGAGKYLARLPLTAMYLADLYALVKCFKVNSGVLRNRWFLNRLGLARPFYLSVVLIGVDPIEMMKEFEIQHAQFEMIYPREAINRIALRVVFAKTFDVAMLPLALVSGEGGS